MLSGDPTGQGGPFWLAVAGAVLVKLITSQYQSLLRAVATVFTAVFAAYFFTDPALDYLSLSPDTYKAPMAALLALTGEGFMRAIIAGANDPKKIGEVWRAFRGGK